MLVLDFQFLLGVEFDVSTIICSLAIYRYSVNLSRTERFRSF